MRELTKSVEQSFWQNLPYLSSQITFSVKELLEMFEEIDGIPSKYNGSVEQNTLLIKAMRAREFKTIWFVMVRYCN